MAVEIVVLIPVLFMFTLFVVAGGRYVSARADADSTARDAARAASQAHTRGEAAAAVRTALDEGLRATRDCRPTGLSGDFESGGTAIVRLELPGELQGPRPARHPRLHRRRRPRATPRSTPTGAPDEAPPPRSEQGSATVFVIGFAIVLFLCAGLVIDGGLAINKRMRIADDAEQAARIGADSIDVERVPAHPRRCGSTSSWPAADQRLHGRPRVRRRQLDRGHPAPTEVSVSVQRHQQDLHPEPVRRPVPGARLGGRRARHRPGRPSPERWRRRWPTPSSGLGET